MSLQLTANDVSLTENEEGFVPTKYWDPYGGVWTIGFGTTSASGVFGTAGMPNTCTRAQATGWLLDYMNKQVLPSLFRVYTPANGNELGALADLGYNVGAGVFMEDPMHTALVSKDKAAIARAFMAYDHAADGQLLPGLVARRDADRALFLRVPPHIPTYHYNWYPGKWQTAVKRYDALRLLQYKGRLTKSETVWLFARRKQCGYYAHQVWLNAVKRHPLSDGKPSWGVEHRGWLYQQLIKRSHGDRVLPS